MKVRCIQNKFSESLRFQKFLNMTVKAGFMNLVWGRFSELSCTSFVSGPLAWTSHKPRINSYQCSLFKCLKTIRILVSKLLKSAFVVGGLHDNFNTKCRWCTLVENECFTKMFFAILQRLISLNCMFMYRGYKCTAAKLINSIYMTFYWKINYF
jgi:hypothetical protein